MAQPEWTDDRGPRPPLALTALADLELLLPLPGTALRDEIDAAARAAGVALRPSMELDGLRMIASLTFDGYGPAILPATAVPAHLRARFCALPARGLPPAPGRRGPAAAGACPRPPPGP